MGREISTHQFDFVPLAGHAPVQVHEALERCGQRAVDRLIEAQLEVGAAKPLDGAPQGLGRILQGGVSPSSPAMTCITCTSCSA